MQENTPSIPSMIPQIGSFDKGKLSQSLSVRRALLLNEALQQAEEAERKRIADYLHDGIAQYLSLASLRLSKLNSGNQHPHVYQTIQEVHDLLLQSIVETRGLIHELHEPAVRDQGLFPVLNAKKTDWERLYQFTIIIRSRLDEKFLKPDDKVLIFRIVSELIRNVAKHANASIASILAKDLGQEIEFCVSDNGKGIYLLFDKQYDLDSGYGLYRIRERLEMASGKLSIESKLGSGTRIRFILPKR
jgi:signal transduction histidine kinase